MATPAAFVFDLETDRFLDATRSNFGDLRITVAAGAWVDLSTGAASETSEYVFDGTDDAGALSRLSSDLDRASTIVAYNGRGFDLKVLEGYVGRARADAWAEKLRDPFEVMRARRDSWVKLDELLLANGLEGKAGDGAAAVAWWQAGERDRVVQYCRADVEALARLVAMEEIRFPVKRWNRESRLHDVVGWSRLRWGRLLRGG